MEKATDNVIQIRIETKLVKPYIGELMFQSCYDAECLATWMTNRDKDGWSFRATGSGTNGYKIGVYVDSLFAGYV